MYGDLDVSMIRDTPPGRLPIKTLAKPESRRDEVHEFVRGQLDAGRQAYVVGGANSAGQAALHLARSAERVTLVSKRVDMQGMPKPSDTRRPAPATRRRHSLILLRCPMTSPRSGMQSI